ncbi:MAG TPA: NADP-dependent oxidoreductase [Thermomicrobiales bacterium]|nr:NADP-dependent oxidoreductase [Thermomicrobiales bacterium]
MKAVRLHAYGDIDQFHVDDIPTPVPASGEVLIRVEASAVNHLDLYLRQGFVAEMMPLDLPAILGGDAAGTVESVGDGVTTFAVGDRVIAHIGVTGRGSHAEYVAVPVAGVAKLPAGVDFERGAALPLSGLTGRQAVDMLGVQPGDRVLVGGALGAVGRAATQYLRELGAVPVAGVRTADLDEGRSVAGEAIDLTDTMVTATFDAAVAASGSTVASTVSHVRPGGKVAGAVMAPEGINPDVSFLSVMHHDDPKHLQGLADAAGRGEITIPIAATFRLEQLGKAHNALAGGARGKVVLRHR